MRTLLVALVWVFGACEIPADHRPAAALARTELAAGTRLQQLMLDEVNALRVKGCKCPDGQYYAPTVPLKWNEQLATAAQTHAEDMVRRGFFSHVNPDGVGFSERIEAAGYPWMVIGENIANGYTSVKETVDAWRRSKGHCNNLMNPEFREMGAAKANQFWVQELGAR
jgi:uncharacterized protein YkwD